MNFLRNAKVSFEGTLDSAQTSVSELQTTDKRGERAIRFTVKSGFAHVQCLADGPTDWMKELREQLTSLQSTDVVLTGYFRPEDKTGRQSHSPLLFYVEEMCSVTNRFIED